MAVTAILQLEAFEAAAAVFHVFDVVAAEMLVGMTEIVLFRVLQIMGGRRLFKTAQGFAAAQVSLQRSELLGSAFLVQDVVLLVCQIAAGNAIPALSALREEIALRTSDTAPGKEQVIAILTVNTFITKFAARNA